jgi:hypothetical protein
VGSVGIALEMLGFIDRSKRAFTELYSMQSVSSVLCVSSC